MERLRLATIWLGGCSGCHMSFLDLDEWLLELNQFADMVYSPIIDTKVYPDAVDMVLVEGAAANDEHIEMLHKVRQRTKLVVAFGDCAVTGNVTAVRNSLRTADAVLHTSYKELVDMDPAIPNEPYVLPVLLDQVQPIHKVIDVDAFLLGCPPPAARIRKLLEMWQQNQPLVIAADDTQFG